VTATAGDGLFIDDDDDGANAAANFTFNFVGTAPNISATGGTAIDITGANGQTNGVAGWTFNNVTSNMSNNEGVLLDDLNQALSITGLVDIDNSVGDGIVARNMGTNVTIANVDLDGTGGDGVQVNGYTGTFSLNGGTIDTAGANSVNVANGASNANFNISNLTITFGVVNGLTGINVQSGDGNVTIANNAIDMNNTTLATGIFVEGNNNANGFNLGTGVSVNNTTSNLGLGSVNFNFNNGANITGDIEVDGFTFNP
jgi:hypothetical protein